VRTSTRTSLFRATRYTLVGARRDIVDFAAAGCCAAIGGLYVMWGAVLMVTFLAFILGLLYFLIGVAAVSITRGILRHDQVAWFAGVPIGAIAISSSLVPFITLSLPAPVRWISLVAGQVLVAYLLVRRRAFGI